MAVRDQGHNSNTERVATEPPQGSRPPLTLVTVPLLLVLMATALLFTADPPPVPVPAERGEAAKSEAGGRESKPADPASPPADVPVSPQAATALARVLCFQIQLTPDKISTPKAARQRLNSPDVRSLIKPTIILAGTKASVARVKPYMAKHLHLSANRIEVYSGASDAIADISLENASGEQRRALCNS